MTGSMAVCSLGCATPNARRKGLLPLINSQQACSAPGFHQKGSLCLESMDPGMIRLVGRTDYCGAARDSDGGLW